MSGMLLSQLASMLDMELRGEDLLVKGVNTLDAAGPDEVSFLANPRYVSKLPTTKAGAVIVAPEHAADVTRALVSQNPYQDFGRMLYVFAKPQGSFSGQSELAFIHPQAQVAPDATIYPFVYIGPRTTIGAGCTVFSGCYIGEDCRIGAKTILYPNAVLMAQTCVGERCIIHPGAVLGADGFGFVRSEAGIEKIPQVGTVSVGNNVEIGANTAIDRAVLDTTRVGDHTKIDNLVQIGHNVQIGTHNFIVSQVGISGSTTLGDGCTLAGQAGLAGHLHIGNKVTIAPQSGVAKDIADGLTVGGSPAVDQRTFMRTLALMPDFPELFKRVSKLERTLQSLSQTPDKE